MNQRMTQMLQSPYLVLTESRFFDNGSVVVGRTSGARGRVIQFINSTLRLYFVALNEIPFIPGETIDGVDDDGCISWYC